MDIQDDRAQSKSADDLCGPHVESTSLSNRQESADGDSIELSRLFSLLYGPIKSERLENRQSPQQEQIGPRGSRFEPSSTQTILGI